MFIIGFYFLDATGYETVTGYVCSERFVLTENITSHVSETKSKNTQYINEGIIRVYLVSGYSFVAWRLGSRLRSLSHHALCVRHAMTSYPVIVAVPLQWLMEASHQTERGKFARVDTIR